MFTDLDNPKNNYTEKGVFNILYSKDVVVIQDEKVKENLLIYYITSVKDNCHRAISDHLQKPVIVDFCMYESYDGVFFRISNGSTNQIFKELIKLDHD